MPLEIAPIDPADRDELFAVAQRYWKGLMPNAPMMRDTVRQRAYFDDRFRLESTSSRHWWAVVDGQRIGFAKIDLEDELEGRSAQVRDFYVEPAFRRQGNGRAFVVALMAWLKSEGVGRVDLHVRRDNPGALAFWEKVGFDLANYLMRAYVD